MSQIHPTAVVEDGAKIGAGVRIGPYCHVGPQVELGDGVELLSHAVVAGITTVGEGTRIFPFASIGHQPQDLKFKGEPSRLVIGKNNTIREGVTMNPGTEGGGMLTRVGDNCLFMAGAHVAHDCLLGNNVIMANNATLAGHIEVGDFAFVGGLAAVHQFCRIGPHAMIGGMSGVEQDVIPYGMVIGNRAHLTGLNLVGLKRRGFEREDITSLRAAYDQLFSGGGTFVQRLDEVARKFAQVALVQEVITFIRNASKRGICQPQADGTSS
ncbi:acyl-ACP--UDP-N-acetylglucosamine O-acyltransferase [uncultured Ferrovibrio sp.]|jgi:UDP-N-acetylglucosamine acyltransferase|uniref:acyl-ACP--UDP-N-acetylglucosamine O-acyltransferase n=1 Tax=uncultured Ferrovibrio sp. TaxID=1576913 RepID=UPI002627F142|nr:acyl-ACP--UDP-N-acetylglucosamine O-acyltransferase [uncultured Ferrovibrio sp.]